MGIKSLWPLLDCTGEKIDLRDFQGQKVAIDLAGWVVQNNQVKMMDGKVAKPHLRNVFFRTAHLIQLGIRPVFVMDGKAPELKMETMAARSNKEVKSLNRSRLKAVMNECKFLLSSMGIQCLQADGEGEALCAQLNADGACAAVITDDSDVFCYGARTVWRNFSVGYSLEKFSMDKIEQDLNLDRNALKVMAILLGCDFFPTGVNGVGKESVMQLLRGFEKHWNALEILNAWINDEFQPNHDCAVCAGDKHCNRCRQLQSSIDCYCSFLKSNPRHAKLENSIKKKCKNVEMNWWLEVCPKIFDEFDSRQNRVPDITQYSELKRPNFDNCLTILTKKLTWTEEYAIEKTIPVLTRWQVESKSKEDILIEPMKILKKRVSNSVKSYQVEWTANVFAAPNHLTQCPANFESTEPADLISEAFPELVRIFEDLNRKPVKKNAASTRLKKNLKENENPKPQSQITEFFTQQKGGKITAVKKSYKQIPEKVLNPVSSVKKNDDVVRVPSSAPVPECDNQVESDMDMSDLSLIIDEIINNKVTNMSIQEDSIRTNEPIKKQENENYFVTSTPVAKNPLKNKLGTRQKDSVSTPLLKYAIKQNQGRILTDNKLDLTPKTPAAKTKRISPDIFNDTEEDSFDRMCK